MTATAITGKNLDVQWINPAGTTSLNGDYRRCDVSETTDLIDASAGADAAKTYVAGLKDSQVQVTTVYQSAGTVLLDAVDDGTSGTLVISPEGTSTGARKITIPALVQSRAIPFAYDGLVEISVTFQGNGAIANGAN